MNKLVLAVFLLAASAPVFAQSRKKMTPPPGPVAPTAGVIKSIPIGAEIPMADVMLISSDGRATSLAQEKRSAGLLVMFSCNTCPYVIKAQPMTTQTMDEVNTLRIGMVVINSNQALRRAEDAPDRMREYAQVRNYTAPYLVDEQSQMANAFGATRTPEVFLFDKNGKLVYKGAMEDNPAEPGKSKIHYLSEAMNAMVAGKPIKLSETKSIGCSIKRMDM